MAPVYGAWAAVTETRAHHRALAVLESSPCADLLEVAVGTGTECARLALGPRRKLCVGIDLSASMLKRARRTSGQRTLLCQADARALPFCTGSFDCLLSCYMLDLIPDGEIALVLQEFNRVLRDRGRLVLVVMGQQAWALQRAWMALFRHVPALVGGCRPIDAAERLRESGWSLETQEPIIQSGFRSEILVARTSRA